MSDNDSFVGTAQPPDDEGKRLALVKIDADMVMMALGMPHETKLVQVLQMKGDDPSVLTLLVQSPDLPIVPPKSMPPYAQPTFTQTFDWNLEPGAGNAQAN